MSFRRPKSQQHVVDREWRTWLLQHERELRDIGLPAGVLLTADHWYDFLQNGYLEWHPDSYDGFDFKQLTNDQMGRLLAVLEASPQYVSQPMVGWLRHRRKGFESQARNSL
jgi:hypothetical protein